MEAQKCLKLLAYVSFLALVSVVSPQPQEDVGSSNAETESKISPESYNQNGPAEAQLINSYLNKDSDPCNDFYSYVCDKWNNNHTTNGSYDSFYMLQQRWLDAVTHMLETAQPVNSPQVVTDKPSVLYKRCMASRREDERETILEIMDSSEFGDWPVTAQNTNKLIFTNASDVISRVGISILIQYYVTRSIYRTTHGITIPLRTLLNIDFAKVNISVEENEMVVVYDPLFYETTNNFLEAANSTSLYNYMGFQFVQHLLSRSPSEAEHPTFKQRQCVGLVYAAMKEAVTSLYARKHFSIQAKIQVEEIVKRIKGAFKEAIKDAKWMDNRTKEIAERKLTTMVAKIGYPPWLLNTTILENHYKYVPTLYSNISFLKMMHMIDDNNEKTNMEKLRQPYEKNEEWYFRRSLVNAFFIGSDNEFVYPVGGLQSPFYQFGLPWSLNFGGVGSVIAHEITHAFAGRASGFDQNGAMGNFTNGKFNEFKATAHCFEYQYGNITDNRTNIRLNGTQTLDENMADSSGLQIALMAYEKLVQEDCENTTTRLEGLENMSGLKLFFVASGMLWCNSIGDEKLRNKIVTDSHSANQYRVNVPMRNLKAFAKAFNCSEDSPMMKNIPHTCTLW